MCNGVYGTSNLNGNEWSSIDIMTGKGDTAKAQGCADERGLGGASSGVRCAGQRQLSPKARPRHRRSSAVLVCSLSDRNPEGRARCRIGFSPSMCTAGFWGDLSPSPPNCKAQLEFKISRSKQKIRLFKTQGAGRPVRVIFVKRVCHYNHDERF